ncbi:MAG: GNAT family N-acetyltransferase [Tenericutes bacterium]|nr:GNAT family N-acetyltransferase [Mycoplasmatota bacterium]
MEKTLKLRIPTNKEFEDWFEISSRSFADDSAYANNTTVEEEYKNIKEKSKQMLPEGKDTVGTIFRVFDDVKVSNGGFVWFGKLPGLKDNEAFLFEITISKEQRSKGYGRKLLTQMHKELKTIGYKKVILNVMKRNYAKNLYFSLGYQTIQEDEHNLIMAIEI